METRHVDVRVAGVLGGGLKVEVGWVGGGVAGCLGVREFGEVRWQRGC